MINQVTLQGHHKPLFMFRIIEANLFIIFSDKKMGLPGFEPGLIGFFTGNSEADYDIHYIIGP